MKTWTEIFASEAKQKLLDRANIRYCVDQDLNLGFYSREEYEKGLSIIMREEAKASF